jgi:hypothetical protein
MFSIFVLTRNQTLQQTTKKYNIMKKYKTGGWDYRKEITEVNIEKETKCFYTIEGVKEAKEAKYHQFHDTYQDAKDYLLEKSKERIEHLRSELEKETERLADLENLQPTA